MAPSFLSKLVKTSTPTHSREGSRAPESRGGSSTPDPTGPTSLSQASSSRTNLIKAEKPLPTIKTSGPNTGRDSPDSTSTHPSVTIVPPSPGGANSTQGLASSEDPFHRPDPLARPDGVAGFAEDDLPTPTPKSTQNFPSSTNGSMLSPSSKESNSGSRSLTPSSSTSNLRELVRNHLKSSPKPAPLDLPPPDLRHQSSKKSLHRAESIPISHSRAATTPAGRSSAENGSVIFSADSIVESPTALRSFTFSSSPPNSGPDLTQTSPSSSFLNPRSATDSDVASIRSGVSAAPSTNGGKTATDTKKKKGNSWRRGSAARKPTGLAGAIAASGLAMAQPTMMMPQISPQNGKEPQRKGTIPYSVPSTVSTTRTRRSPNDTSPRSKRDKHSPTTSRTRVHSRRPSTSVSVSIHSENPSEIYGDAGDYSGVEENSDDDDDSQSEDDLMDLDLGEDDIPVTGFAVASNKRNADFHELFPTIPEGDYLIEDYGCAMQREILIQGRLYISENHICFHANIFGWVTDISIPIYEITSLEKKMTAFVIPNAIQITTRQSKSTFASFLSRDTTFDVIFNIWRLARPEDSLATSSPRGSLEASRPGMDEIREGGEGLAVQSNGIVVGTQPKTQAPRKVTQCACSKDGSHLSETPLETILPGTPDRIHNLIFASGFIKDFMRVDQKLLDIQISDWTPVTPGSKLLARNMSYIKPLTGSLGPKQTKCEIRDETLHADFDDYSVTLTTTRTPDVPSGGVFSVKTRTCIMWASNISTKVIVTSQVEWTGRSFIKGIIEKSAIEGQKVYHADLDRAMRKYIQDHQSEFIPEGVDLAEVTPEPETPAPDAATVEKNSSTAAEKERERERNARGLQWAYDTFEGAYGVAKQSTNGALELIRDAWDQSTSTTILYFVIVILVISNLWTLTIVGSREEAGRRKTLRKMEEREKWVHSVVTSLWEELAAGKAGPVSPAGSELQGILDGHVDPTSTSLIPQIPAHAAPSSSAWSEELANLHKSLDDVEIRVRLIRESLTTLDSVD